MCVYIKRKSIKEMSYENISDMLDLETAIWTDQKLTLLLLLLLLCDEKTKTTKENLTDHYSSWNSNHEPHHKNHYNKKNQVYLLKKSDYAATLQITTCKYTEKLPSSGSSHNRKTKLSSAVGQYTIVQYIIVQKT